VNPRPDFSLRFFGLLAIGCVAAIPPGPADDASRIAAARRLIIETRYCALITIGEDGQPQARTIDPSPPDSRMVVWFATDSDSRKVRQIERDPRVTLYYFDDRSPGYVTLIGTARVVVDAEAKQKQWLEKWTPFYSGGAGAAVVFEVTPRRIEIVDVARGIVGDPQTWAPPSVDIKPR
jgi:PPOX class probable F420-dependent enzyme